MESTGAPGLVQCSHVTADLLNGSLEFALHPRGRIQVKGKGLMDTFWVL